MEEPRRGVDKLAKMASLALEECFAGCAGDEREEIRVWSVSPKQIDRDVLLGYRPNFYKISKVRWHYIFIHFRAS